MRNKTFISYLFISLAFLFNACEEQSFEFGDINAPSNLNLTVEIFGQDDSNPFGDGSGDITITMTADNAISYKFSIDGSVIMSPSGVLTTTLTKLGTEKYIITGIAIGVAGTTSSMSVESQVSVTFSPPDEFYGAWRIDPSAGSMAVGPTPSNLSWWSSGDDTADERACFYDDLYIFNQDGTFQNDLGDVTWLESWQGVPDDQCGSPVAPHDGSGSLTYSITRNLIILNGPGAFLGLPKVHNAGEINSPNQAVSNISYNYILSEDSNILELNIQYNGENTWYFRLVKAD